MLQHRVCRRTLKRCVCTRSVQNAHHFRCSRGDSSKKSNAPSGGAARQRDCYPSHPKPTIGMMLLSMAAALTSVLSA